MSCRHDIRCTEQECLYLPTHWSKSSEAPHLVIETFVNNMQECYRNNLRTIRSLHTVSYGDGKQKIDIWGDELESTAAIALFHGGYWQEGDRKLFTSPVKPLTDEGFIVACVGYDFATLVGLNNVVEQAAKALDFLAKRWPSKKLSVGGHSAGGHLAISALKRIEDEQRYEKLLLFSGIYNLHPLLDTYIGKSINLTLAEAETLSIVNLDGISAELFVAVGSEESPKIKEQNQQIVENYLQKHDSISISDCYMIVPNSDHFTLIVSLAEKNSIITTEMLRFVLRK